MQWLWPRIHGTDQTLVWYTFKRASKSGFLLQNGKFCFIGAHMPNQPYNWDNSKIITTNRRYHQRLCFLSEKRQLISDHIKGPLVAAFRSPLMKALDRSVKTLGLWIVTSSVTFIKSANQSSIKPCQAWESPYLLKSLFVANYIAGISAIT